MTNVVINTALKTIANDTEAALSGPVAKTVEASSGWLDAFTGWVDKIDGYVWGVPLIAAILVTGLLLTCVLRLNHLFNLKNAFRYMFHTEEGTAGDVSSFGALCTALSATIGTGNIVGVATAIGTGGPGALFWMWVAALVGTASGNFSFEASVLSLFLFPQATKDKAAPAIKPMEPNILIFFIRVTSKLMWTF